MKKALVLGGGIQGCCIALMLRKHDYDVKIIDKSNDIFNRASLNQEGKVHMGFNWGMDASLKTGKKLLLDSLHFAPYLEYLLGKKVNWEKLKSTKFNYLVAKDSLLSADEIESYYKTLQTIYCQYLEDEKLTYLGKRPKTIFKKISLPTQVNPDFFQACFSTEEVSLRPENFKEIIKEKIQTENISLCLNQCVTNSKRTPQGFMVETNLENGDVGQFESNLVFNCLWEGKMILDKQMGLPVEKGINLRFKSAIITKSHVPLNGLNSFTIIQGPYGDFVQYPQSNETYYCWYPSSLKGMVVDQSIPTSWEEACDGKIPQTVRQKLVNENFKHFQRLIPTLSDFQVLSIIGGVIMGRGHQDIHHADSQLHERNEFPITHKDGYYSINTGKFSSAPRNTYLLEKMLGYQYDLEKFLCRTIPQLNLKLK